MDKVTMGARILLGLIFFVFGLNGFLGFIQPPPLSEAAGSFMGALAATGYFFPFLKASEVVAGAMLLSNKFVALSLLILAPITLNILLFHGFLDPAGMAMAVICVALNVFLGWRYKDSYAGVLKA